MNTASRNRAIKKALETAFGNGNVSVKGGRGTSYGWVYIHVNHNPGDKWQELYALVQKLAIVAARQVGSGIGYFETDMGMRLAEVKISFAKGSN